MPVSGRLIIGSTLNRRACLAHAVAHGRVSRLRLAARGKLGSWLRAAPWAKTRGSFRREMLWRW